MAELTRGAVEPGEDDEVPPERAHGDDRRAERDEAAVGVRAGGDVAAGDRRTPFDRWSRGFAVYAPADRTGDVDECGGSGLSDPCPLRAVTAMACACAAPTLDSAPCSSARSARCGSTQRSRQRGVDGRYRQHTLLRQYAFERLAAEPIDTVTASS